MKIFVSILFYVIWSMCLLANEFEIKREKNFEFAQEPKMLKTDDGYKIIFETKSYCDVSVAVVDEYGNIQRHFVSGILGKNAPLPFKKNSKLQELMFDGKNDQGEYIKDLNKSFVKISLGLQARFEKSLYDTPFKRHSECRQLMVGAQEGVYVYEGGNGLDFVKLLDWNGEYIKTIYPFPADKIDTVKGLHWQENNFIKEKYPKKINYLQSSFLNTGCAYSISDVIPTTFGHKHYGMYGYSSSILSVNKEQLVIGMGHLANLFGVTDGK